jgi:hypothetical protein
MTFCLLVLGIEPRARHMLIYNILKEWENDGALVKISLEKFHQHKKIKFYSFLKSYIIIPDMNYKIIKLLQENIFMTVVYRMIS